MPRCTVSRSLLAVSLVALWTAPVAAGPSYDQIVAFGDSLSDAGNGYILSGGTDPAPPYYQGRYSNGPIWVDYLATKLGVPDPGPSLAGGTNYAYGGATAASAFSPAGIPDLGQQIQQYLQHSPKANPNALYTISVGGNDLLNGQSDPSVPANAVGAGLTSLIAAGAKTILVLNLPPYGATPLLRSYGPGAVAQIDALVEQFNADLAGDVKSLQAADPGVQIDLVDFYSQTNKVLQDPAAYGFTNVTDPGIDAPANANLSQYLFWDLLHPTTAGQAQIADAAFLAVVPEPAGLTLAGVCGVIGLGARAWKRKRAGGASAA